MHEQEFNMANALAVAFESKAKMVQMFTRDYSNETNTRIEKQLDTLDVQIKQMLSLCEREVALQEKHLELMSQADEDEHHCHCGGNCHCKPTQITLPSGMEVTFVAPTAESIQQLMNETDFNEVINIGGTIYTDKLFKIFDSLGCFRYGDGSTAHLDSKMFVK